jgi:hypothetical protein
MDDLQQQLEYLLRQNAPFEWGSDLGASVLDAIDAYLGRFVAYPDVHARHAHTLWIAHTWFMDCWYTTPRLAFISPEAGSGKTRALTISQYLVPHPDLTADLTPAYLFHSIDLHMGEYGTRPTLLYDEFDTVFVNGRGNAYMRRLIDAGHAKNATVNRMVSRKNGGPKRYEIYAAMAMAGMMDIYDLPSTIKTRSVVIRMQRRAPDEVVERWDRRSALPEAERLVDLLRFWAEFVHNHAMAEGGYIPEVPDKVTDRDRDVWEPLLSVAELAGGRWPEMARAAAVAFVEAAGSKATPSQGVQLLWDIRTVFDRTGKDALFTTRLISELASLEESQWTGLTSSSRGGGMTIGRLLSRYTVEPRRIRIGERTGRGYRRADFAEAWRRYPPPIAGSDSGEASR